MKKTLIYKNGDDWGMVFMALLYPCTHIKNTLELPPGEAPRLKVGLYIHPGVNVVLGGQTYQAGPSNS